MKKQRYDLMAFAIDEGTTTGLAPNTKEAKWWDIMLVPLLPSGLPDWDNVKL